MHVHKKQKKNKKNWTLSAPTFHIHSTIVLFRSMHRQCAYKRQPTSGVPPYVMPLRFGVCTQSGESTATLLWAPKQVPAVRYSRRPGMNLNQASFSFITPGGSSAHAVTAATEDVQQKSACSRCIAAVGIRTQLITAVLTGRPSNLLSQTALLPFSLRGY